MTSQTRHLVLIVAGILWMLPGALNAQDEKVATGKEIMIVAHPLAAEAGLAMHKRGGTVVDVAVASAYALGVVEPHGSGIGGEGMMLIYTARTGSYTVIDFKGIAPARASYGTLDFGAVSTWAKSAKGASVPGAVAGLELARERYGRLDRQTVLQPAIDLALKGFKVDSTLNARLKGSQATLMKDPYSARTFYPNHAVPETGARLTNPEYGATLQEIQTHGPDAFYRGTIARAIANDMERSGGFITMEDLAAYRAIEREPLKGSYHGFDIITTPPPCGGMHLLEALNILSFFNLDEFRRADATQLHLLAETFKLVFKDERTHNGDPDVVRVPVDAISSHEFAASRMRSIELGRALHPTQVEAGRVQGRHTTHLSVMDAEGNAVALTITLSSMFGTAHTVEGAGFLLNNEMQNYDPDSTAANALRPHARVVTSLVPTILARQGKPVYVLGLPGGDAIISTMTQVIVNLLDFKMSLPDAVAAPRIFTIFNQRSLEMERPVSETSVRLLQSLGHDIELWNQDAFFGVIQAVVRDSTTGELLGVSDRRRSGAALGY